MGTLLGFRCPQFSEDVAWLPAWLQQHHVGSFDEHIKDEEIPLEQQLEISDPDDDVRAKGTTTEEDKSGCVMRYHLEIAPGTKRGEKGRVLEVQKRSQGRGVIEDFVGMLIGQKARKGVVGEVEEGIGSAVEVSGWVKRHVRNVSGDLGVVAHGFEGRLLQLFSDIEDRNIREVLNNPRKDQCT
ncbi:hypothetical protein F0562_013513 [Nyssa sinensis]|uniref:Uncharacterized protein n=1 Tax=Nyssa sinensis TaxID=561372 RepID=A0A5J4ZQ46_9ASTE|nr:hypothetical protein F0562_013513 [Nyssa sinensis]